MRTGRFRCRGTRYKLVEGFAAIVTDVFVNGHRRKAQSRRKKTKLPLYYSGSVVAVKEMCELRSRQGGNHGKRVRGYAGLCGETHP